MPSNIKNISEKSSEMSTAKALYLLFRALPKKERIEAARYILEDEEIRYRSELFEIPNNTTLKSLVAFFLRDLKVGWHIALQCDSFK